MSIDSKTLRALAKHSGYQPSKIFRMQPAEVLEMLTEKYPDVKEWDNDKALATIEELTSAPSSPKEEEVVKDTEEPKAEESPKKKRTRRTKAQIAADKEKVLEKETQTEKVVTMPSKKEREAPSRKRKKKRTPVLSSPSSVGVDNTEILLILKEMANRIKELEGSVEEVKNENRNLTVSLDDLSMFLTWFHNVKIDPIEPIESLSSIHWDATIADQVKNAK